MIRHATIAVAATAFATAIGCVAAAINWYAVAQALNSTALAPDHAATNALNRSWWYLFGALSLTVLGGAVLLMGRSRVVSRSKASGPI